MSYILASSKPVIKPTADYEKLKTKLRNSTTGYGTAIVASYFITQGAAEGVSATVGVASSLAYLSSLTKYVDELESSPLQAQILIPVGTAIFESMWNNAPFSFDFDYGATFVGFLAYKFALMSVLYETVRDMIIRDGSDVYSDKEVEYKDLTRDEEYEDASSYDKL